MKKTKKPEKEITIIGFVEEFDDDDTEGLIIATDEEDYVVELDKKGKKLFNEIDKDVEATGIVTTDEEGTKRITISSFEVLDDDDFDDDDFDYQDDDDEK